MKILLLAISIVMISCCSPNKTTDGTDYHIHSGTTQTGIKNEHNDESENDLPVCIKKLIEKFMEEEKQNPLRSLYRYTYNGATVYFAPAICCDFFSDLYDNKCNLIAHPDGGFTGRGDGKAPDFLQTRTNEKLLWKDQRK